MHAFEAHFRGALPNGIPEKDFGATPRPVATHWGYPAAVEAYSVAKKALAKAARACTESRYRDSRIIVLNVPSSQGTERLDLAMQNRDFSMGE